jgi:hypothetical protein
MCGGVNAAPLLDTGLRHFPALFTELPQEPLSIYAVCLELSVDFGVGGILTAMTDDEYGMGFDVCFATPYAVHWICPSDAAA